MANGKKMSKGSKVALGIVGGGLLGGIIYKVVDTMFGDKNTDTEEVELLEEKYSEVVEEETEDER